MGEPVPAEVARVFSEAELLHSAGQVEQALDDMAADITALLGEANPVLLCIMTGGIVPTGMLLPRLHFPLQLDYAHATRYEGKTSGGRLRWVRAPNLSLENRTVLIVDDILDKGVTLSSIRDECFQLGADKVYTAVLVDKQTPRIGNIDQADFTGLKIPDRYVFGYGMDYKNYLRNSPGIYAVKES
ncbi:MAG: hypoxanthine-guanine phosphoribosyltransferase [Gammaproteobacteria bacterium]|nr:hypoxanthine-guanine phosphoribosyltransferase [Gammaproteobacteria bacterium]